MNARLPLRVPRLLASPLDAKSLSPSSVPLSSGLLEPREFRSSLQDGPFFDLESGRPPSRGLVTGTRVPRPRHFARWTNICQHRFELQCLPHCRCRRWLLVHHTNIQHHIRPILPLEPGRDGRLRNQLLAWVRLLCWSWASSPSQPELDSCYVLL